MKTDWQLGKEKKLQVCRKTTNTDIIFMSGFFHAWRFNESNDKLEETIANNKAKQDKQKSLTRIASLNSKNTTAQLKNVIHRFRQYKAQKARRIAGIQNKFMRVINDNNENLLK